MYEFLSDAFKALSGYPIIQASVAVLVFLAGIHVMRRGEKDRKSNGAAEPVIPSWALYGPAHEAMGAIHEMNEQSRQQVELLRRVEELLKGLDHSSRVSKAILEVIRNESRLR